jgi:molybdenum cofactor cytidylyltransferase
VLAAVILAAGQSSRMGAHKALVDFRGKTFLARLLEVTKHPQIGLTRVVLGAGDEEIRAALQLPEEIVILNPEWRRGQLSSIQAAVRALSDDPLAEDSIDGVLLCPVDHPLISGELVASLVDAFYYLGQPIVVPTFNGRRGHPVIFARSLFAELLAAPDDQGARAVVWEHAADVAEVPTEEEGVVLNLDDPETLRRAPGGK